MRGKDVIPWGEVYMWACHKTERKIRDEGQARYHDESMFHGGEEGGAPSCSSVACPFLLVVFCLLRAGLPTFFSPFLFLCYLLRPFRRHLRFKPRSQWKEMAFQGEGNGVYGEMGNTTPPSRCFLFNHILSSPCPKPLSILLQPYCHVQDSINVIFVIWHMPSVVASWFC